MDRFTLELDVVIQDGETAEGAGRALANHWPPALTQGLPPVTVEVVREVGPAGGWPVLRFTGTYLALALVAATYAGVGGTVGMVIETLTQARLVTPTASPAPVTTGEEG